MDHSDKRIEESLHDTDEDLSTQKYGSFADYMKKQKVNVNIDEDTSLIATEDDSSIDSYSLPMNDNLSNSITKERKMSTADQYLGE